MPHRFFLAELPAEGTTVLDGLEAHHLIHVMRGGAGDVVELFNGAGLVAQAEIAAVRRRDAELRILSSKVDGRPSRRIVLATAVPKGDRFDWLIEKATELGVAQVIPLTTARSVVDPRDSKLEKLRQTVIAACKQSGRNFLLELSPVSVWHEFVQTTLPKHLSFIAHPGSQAGRLCSPQADDQTVVIVVGPEGGFSDEEVATALAAGAKPVSLGPLILRIETAALALVASLQITDW